MLDSFFMYKNVCNNKTDQIKNKKNMIISVYLCILYLFLICHFIHFLETFKKINDIANTD
jgi:L-cystine uptake protein TcyP (sodium:dicarboxylate symporter family)